MTQLIEGVSAHYEVQNVEMGKKVYTWCPERAVVACNCGNRETFIAFRTPSCSNCGADHADIVGEALSSYPVFWRCVKPYYAPTGTTHRDASGAHYAQ